MEMLSLAAFDDHTCVYCRIKINGLSNYIEHIKTCEPFDSIDRKSVPRLPLIRTPSRESLQSEVELESLAGSDSSLGSYMQRIYDDMERYAKEVLGCDSTVVRPCREVPKGIHSYEKNGDEGFISRRLTAVPVQPRMDGECSQSDIEATEGLGRKLKEIDTCLNSGIPVQALADSADCMTEESNEDRLNESGVSVSSTFSGKVALFPEGSIVTKSDNNVLKESGFSLNSPDEIRERNSKENVSKKVGTSAQDLLENSSSNVTGTSSMERKSEPTEEIPVSIKDSKKSSSQSSFCSGFKISTNDGVKVCKVWGRSSELLTTSFKLCMHQIFSMLTSHDKYEVLFEVEEMCKSYLSKGGEIEIKIIHAVNKMNVLIKRVEANKGVELEEEKPTPEALTRKKKNESSMGASGDEEIVPKTMTNLPESSQETGSKIGRASPSIAASNSPHMTQEESITMKENIPRAAPNSPADISALKTSNKSLSREGSVSICRNCRSSCLKKIANGESVSACSKNCAHKEFCDDQVPFLHRKTISPLLSPMVSKKASTNNLRKSPFKIGNDEDFNGVHNSMSFDSGDNDLQISNDNMVDNALNETFLEAEDIENISTILQKNGKQNKETIVVGCENRGTCELKNSRRNLSSPGETGTQLESRMVCVPYDLVSDYVFFSSLEDVGLQVEVGSNVSSSSMSEDLQINDLCSKLIPLELEQAKRGIVVRKGRKRKAGSCGRGIRGKIRKVSDKSSVKRVSQDCNKNLLKTLRGPTYGRGGNRIGSQRNIRNMKGAEITSDLIELHGVTMGLQRYNFRNKPTEGFSSGIKEMLGDAVMKQEGLNSGAELSEARSLDDNGKVRTLSKKGFCKTEGSKDVDSVPLAGEMMCGKEPRQVMDILHPKATSLDSDHRDKNLISIIKETDLSNHVEEQLDTDLSVGITNNMDLECVPEVRGFIGFDDEDIPRKRKDILERYSGITKNVDENSANKPKMKFLINRGRIQQRKMSRIPQWRYNIGSLTSLSRLNQPRYHFRKRLLLRFDKFYSSNSESSEEDEDLEWNTKKPPAEGLGKKKVTGLDPSPSYCRGNPQRLKKSGRYCSGRKGKRAETDEVNLCDSDHEKQVGDGDQGERTAIQNQSASESSSDENDGLESTGYISLPAPRNDKNCLHVEMDEKPQRNTSGYPEHREDTVRMTGSITSSLKCKQGEEALECKNQEKWSGHEIKTLRLNEDDKEGLKLINMLKPFKIDLGFRCDSKEFLSEMRSQNLITSINVNLCKGSRRSLNKGENGDTSTRRKMTTGHDGLGEQERKITHSNTCSQSITKEAVPALVTKSSIKYGVNIPQISNCSINNKPRMDRKLIAMEDIPELLQKPLQEVCDQNTYNGSVEKDSRSPKTEKDENDRKPVQISSQFTEDDEIQIVVEFIKRDKVGVMQAHIDRLKGWRVVEPIKELKPESLARAHKQESFSIDETHLAHRDTTKGMFQNEIIMERRSANFSEVTGKMTASFCNEKEDDNQAEDLVGNLHESVSENGLSNILITEIRCGAELTEEEGNIPLDDDVSAPCADKVSITRSASVDLVDGYNGKDRSFPDVMVPPSGNSLNNKGTYIHPRYGYSKDRNLPVYNVESAHLGESIDQSVRVERIIPLITLVDETNEVQRTEPSQKQILHVNGLKNVVNNSNAIKTTNQLMRWYSLHEIEQRNVFRVNPSGNCSSSSGLAICKKRKPSTVSKPILSLKSAAPKPSECRRPATGSHGVAKPQISINKSQDVPLCNDPTKCNWEVYHSVATTLPPNIPSTLQSIPGFAETRKPQSTIAFQFKDENQFLELLKLQNLGHCSIAPNQEESEESVNKELAGCSVSLAQPQLIKLGEIVSNSIEKVKEEINVLVKSHGVRALLTQPSRYQLGRIILYNAEESRPESNTVRVDYCKMRQKQ